MYIHEPACFYKLHFFNTKSCMLYHLHNKQNIVRFYHLRCLLDMSTWCHRDVLQALSTLKPTRKTPHPLHARGTTLLTTVLNSCHNIFGNCISLSRQEYIHSCILLCYYCQIWLVLRSYYRKPVWYIVWKDTFFFFFYSCDICLKKPRCTWVIQNTFVQNSLESACTCIWNFSSSTGKSPLDKVSYLLHRSKPIKFPVCQLHKAW